MHAPAISGNRSGVQSGFSRTHERLITRREWRRVIAVAALMALVTTLPYLAAWSAQGAGWRFSGFLFGVEDGNSYLGKMRLGARGLWDFHLFYTAEPHDGAPLLFLPYLLPGQLTGLVVERTDPALTPLLVLVYHGMRVVFGILLIAVLYRFIALFARRPIVRALALWLAILGGGLGWVLAFAGFGLAPEFYIPEGFTFLILFGLPHLALARAALLTGLMLLVEIVDGHRPLAQAALAAICWIVVGLAVPFYLAIIYLLLGVWGLALWLRRGDFPTRLAFAGGVSAAISLPLFAYYAVVLGQHPAFSQWSAQNQLPSPPPLHYLLAYIVLLIPAWAGWRFAWRRARLYGRYALLAAWPLMALPVVYVPINVQRRLGEGVLVPLALLAATGLYATARAWGMKHGRHAGRRFLRLALPVAAVASISSLIVYLGSWGAATTRREPVFRPATEIEALAWLNRHAAPGSVVLSAPSTGNVLPAYADVRAYVGHGPETIGYAGKSDQVRRFFSGAMSEAERLALLEGFDVAYVFYGPAERALSGSSVTAAAPRWTDTMQRVYSRHGYNIYAVAGR